jgi:hypothetical protein
VSAAFAEIEARSTPPESTDAARSGTNFDAAPDVSSTPPTPLDRALDRMIGAQSHVVGTIVEKPTKQRIVGLSRQSGGGLLQRLAPGSLGPVGRYGKDRSALAAARLAE